MFEKADEQAATSTSGWGFSTTADSTGHFVFPLFRGVTYRLLSYGNADREPRVKYSRPLSLTVDRDIKGLNLTLSEDPGPQPGRTR
jgi:hypothetical protein